MRYSKVLCLCITSIFAISGMSMALTGCNRPQSNDHAKTAASSELPVPEGSECLSHKSCGPGSACLNSVCVNINHVSCKNDLDCPEYQKCFDGTCASCKADTDCKSNYQCDNGVCIPKDPNFVQCKSASECQNGQTCIDGLCTNFCNGIKDCGASFPAPQCTSTNNMMLGICQTITPCRDKLKCDEKSGNCTHNYTCSNPEDRCFQGSCLKYSCQSNDECGESQICKDHTCTDVECKKDDQCSNGACIDNQCGCKKDSQCNEDSFCNDGKCEIAPCKTGDQCASGKCTHYTCTCKSDDQCGPKNICQNGLCKAVECKEKSDCFFTEKCIENTCTKCKTDEHCEDNQHCKEIIYSGYSFSGYEYTFHKLDKPKFECTECAQDADCPTDKPICTYDGMCVECFQNKDCKDGMKCQSNKCVARDTYDNAPIAPQKDCEKSEDCADNEFCTFKKKCAEKAKPCQADTDCGTEGKCTKRGFCQENVQRVMGIRVYDFCDNDSQCAHMGGGKCNPVVREMSDQDEDGKLITKQYRECRYMCKTDNECDEGEICSLGVCTSAAPRKYCRTDQNCPENFECNNFYHECVPANSTPLKHLLKKMDPKETGDLIGKFMLNIEVAKIINECWRDSDCKDGKICLSTGECGCFEDSQCGANQLCENSKCSCKNDDGCGPGFTCKFFDSYNARHECVCKDDSACKDGKVCRDGECREKPQNFRSDNDDSEN